MRKFRPLLWTLAAATVLAGCSTLGAVAGMLGNQVSFTAPQLQGYLDRRFPRDYDKLGGLVTLSVLNPRLSIPQGSHRLRLDFDVGFGALGRDLNSGWNWHATKYGCWGSSIISTSRPSGDSPDSTMPWRSRASR